MKKTTILFDFDGTIADSIPLILNSLIKLAPRFGYTPITMEEFQALRQYEVMDLLKHFHIPLYKLPFIISKSKQQIRNQIKDMELCKGIDKLLLELHGNGIRMGIVSSSPKNHIDEFLRNYQIGCFEFVDSELNIFGKDKAILKAIQTHNLVIEETVYVGDEIRDIKACQKAGIDIISVTWGFNNEQGLIKHGAMHIANTPEDIQLLLRSYS